MTIYLKDLGMGTRTFNGGRNRKNIYHVYHTVLENRHTHLLSAKPCFFSKMINLSSKKALNLFTEVNVSFQFIPLFNMNLFSKLHPHLCVRILFSGNPHDACIGRKLQLRTYTSLNGISMP